MISRVAEFEVKRAGSPAGSERKRSVCLNVVFRPESITGAIAAPRRTIRRLF
jgi:hypothetical protein